MNLNTFSLLNLSLSGLIDIEEQRNHYLLEIINILQDDSDLEQIKLSSFYWQCIRDNLPIEQEINLQKLSQKGLTSHRKCCFFCGNETKPKIFLKNIRINGMKKTHLMSRCRICNKAKKLDILEKHKSHLKGKLSKIENCFKTCDKKEIKKIFLSNTFKISKNSLRKTGLLHLISPPNA